MSNAPTPVDPPALFRSPAFAQGMIAPAGPTLYIGGQNGVDAEGTLLKGLRAQTEQALRNVIAVLEEAGTDREHVVKLTIYLAGGIDPMDAFAASAEVWGTVRTAVSVLTLTPSKPGALVEIEAIASIPQR